MPYAEASYSPDPTEQISYLRVSAVMAGIDPVDNFSTPSLLMALTVRLHDFLTMHCAGMR